MPDLDLKPVLDRGLAGFHPSFDAYERTLGRVDRRGRNRRIGTAIVALVVAVASLAGAFAVFRSGRSEVPAAPITPQNAARLGLAWTATLDGPAPWLSSSSVGSGIVAVSTDDRLYAFESSCSGATECDPLWTADLDIAPRSAAEVVEDGGVVYAMGANTLYAFSADCGTGGATCEPLWTGRTDFRTDGKYAKYGRVLQVVSGVVYVYQQDDVSSLYAFDAACGAGGATCEPTSVGPVPPALPISDGRVTYVTSADGREVSALPSTCSAAATCPPRWTWSAPGNERIGRIVASGGVALVFVHLHKRSEGVYAASGTCEGTSCSPTRLRGADGAWGDAAISHGLMFVRDGPIGGPARFVGPTYQVFYAACATVPDACDPLFRIQLDGFNYETLLSTDPQTGTVFAVNKYGKLAALGGDPHVLSGRASATCGRSPCGPAWLAHELGDWTTTVTETNGVVFVGSGFVGRLDAYSEDCGTAGTTCDPLWSSSVPVRGTAVALHDAVVAVSGDRLLAFAPGGTADPSEAGGTGRPLWSWLLPLLVIVLAVLMTGFRRVRQSRF